MRPALPLLIAALVAGCGGDPSEDEPGAIVPGATPNRLPVVEGADRGRLIVTQAGCLACHRIGEMGNDNVGPQLTEVGQRMPSSAIRRALVNPTAPMPSYEDLGAGELDELTRYLSGLDR